MKLPLVKQKCLTEKYNTHLLNPEEIKKLLTEIPRWELSADGKKLWLIFKFKKFPEALNFINLIGDLAESENHYPDIHYIEKNVYLELQTPALKGLTINDFILAAKIDQF